MKCLVTGGAGFIGSHLVDKLIEQGQEVIVIDNLSSAKAELSSGKKENLNSQAKLYQADIRDEEVAKIFAQEKPEIIFHCAAQINVRMSVENPLEDAKTNILGSLNLLENCKKQKVKKIIFSSTGGAIYGNAAYRMVHGNAEILPTPEGYPEFPLSPYGIAKLAVEKYLNYYFRIHSIPFVSLRYGNVYGPRQNSKGEAGVVAIFLDKMLSGGQPIINGTGEQTRDFVFVEDIVNANLLAMKTDKTGVYNIATGKETSIKTIFEMLNKLSKTNAKEIHGEAKPGEEMRVCLDFSKAKRELNWEPKYNLEEGLEKTVEWFVKCKT